MKYFIVLVLIAVQTASLVWADDLSKSRIRTQIQAEISNRHPDPTSAFWNGLGDEAPVVIIEMLRENPGVYSRIRLIEGLGYFSNAEVDQFLKNEITQTKNKVVQKKTLLALVQSEGDAAFDFVEPYLNDRDVALRKELVKHLVRYAPSERVQNRIQKFTGNENVKVTTELNTVQRLGAEVVIPSKRDAMLGGRWVGQWMGKNIKSVILNLALIKTQGMDDEKKWKLTFESYKSTEKFSEALSDKKEEAVAPFELQHFQTPKKIWIEVRFKNTDAVFIGTRSAN